MKRTKTRNWLAMAVLLPVLAGGLTAGCDDDEDAVPTDAAGGRGAPAGPAAPAAPAAQAAPAAPVAPVAAASMPATWPPWATCRPDARRRLWSWRT